MPSLAELQRETALPVIIADQDGNVTRINDRFTAVFGWDPSALVGRPLATIIPPALRDAHHLGFSRFLTTGAPTLLGQPLKLAVITSDGREVMAEHFIVAEQQGGRWVFAASLRPLA